MELTDENPTAPGWYATTYSWDETEGSFGGAQYWTGTEWRDRHGYCIWHWPQRFDSQEAADAKAETLPTW